MLSGNVMRVGKTLAVGAIVFFLGAFGLAKFTPQEMATIKPLVSHSPVLSWLPPVVGYNVTCYLIGIVEIATAILLLARPLNARASAVGGVLAASIFVVTLSFLVSTPDLEESAAGFIIKDIALFAIAIWWVGDSLNAHNAAMLRRKETHRLA